MQYIEEELKNIKKHLKKFHNMIRRINHVIKDLGDKQSEKTPEGYYIIRFNIDGKLLNKRVKY